MQRVRDADSKTGHAIKGQTNVREKANAAHTGTSRINSVVSNRTFVEAVFDEHVAADSTDTSYKQNLPFLCTSSQERGHCKTFWTIKSVRLKSSGMLIYNI